MTVKLPLKLGVAARYLNCDGLDLLAKGDLELIDRAYYYSRLEQEAEKIKIEAERSV